MSAGERIQGTDLEKQQVFRHISRKTLLPGERKGKRRPERKFVKGSKKSERKVVQICERDVHKKCFLSFFGCPFLRGKRGAVEITRQMTQERGERVVKRV